MAHDADPGTWAAIGLAVGGFFAGLAGAVGLRKRAKAQEEEGAEPISASTQAQIQDLRDQVRDMKNAIENLKEVQRNDAAQRQRIEEKHDQVVVEIFKKLEAIGLNVNTMQTQIGLALNQAKS